MRIPLVEIQYNDTCLITYAIRNISLKIKTKGNLLQNSNFYIYFIFTVQKEN